MVITLAQLIFDTSPNESQSCQTNSKLTGTQFFEKDITKPDGKACNTDGI